MISINNASAKVETHAQTFFCVGSNHRTATIATREQFYLSPDQVETSLAKISLMYGLDEIAVISTCNRCEVFGVIKDQKRLSSEFLYRIYTSIHPQGADNPNFNLRNLQQTLYTLTGLDAVRHAFHVASSLDSLVPGETQITGQFKDAMALAKNAGTLGSMLTRLSQEALATAKKIRTNTDIGRHKVSISHAAIDLARRASSDLSKLRFLILGAGEMARVAAEYAASYKPQSFIIANRTKQKAFELTQHLGFGEAHGLDNLSHLISRSDVVISATGASGFVITSEHVKSGLKNRQNVPLFLIDIALPRDIEPTVAKFDDVYLFDIDDLKSVVDTHLEKRREAIRAATDIVTESVDNFEQWLLSKVLTPTISASSQYFNDIFRRESAKTLSKEIFNNLSDKQRESINSMLDAIASKLTADVAQALRKSVDDDARNLAAALDLIFKKD